MDLIFTSTPILVDFSVSIRDLVPQSTHLLTNKTFSLCMGVSKKESMQVVTFGCPHLTTNEILKTLSSKGLRPATVYELAHFIINPKTALNAVGFRSLVGLGTIVSLKELGGKYVVPAYGVGCKKNQLTLFYSFDGAWSESYKFLVVNK